MDRMEKLFQKIMLRIHKEQRFSVIKRRIFIFSIMLIGSGIALFPVLYSLEQTISESGFLQFLSLLFSDFEIVATYWQNFALSLLESLPILNLIMLLAVLLVFLQSIKVLAKNIKIILPQYNH